MLSAAKALIGTLALGFLASSAHAAFPEGKPISVIVPFAAGGPTDVGSRVLAPFLEKELGTTIQVINKPGAGTQIGITELVRSRPDGLTVAMVAPPTAAMTYLDPERKAPYGRKDIQPVALYTSEANLLIVPGNSPYTTVQEFLQAAKTKKMRVGTSGLMTSAHFAGIVLEEVSGARFAFVHFNGAAPQATAMLGGNLEAAISGILATVPHQRAGTMRILGTMDLVESKYLPGIKPLRDQGADVYSPVTFGLIAPAGVPKDVIKTLSAAVRKAMAEPDLVRKLEQVALTPTYMDDVQFEKFWGELEERTKSLLAIAKSRQD